MTTGTKILWRNQFIKIPPSQKSFKLLKKNLFTQLRGTEKWTKSLIVKIFFQPEAEFYSPSKIHI